MKKLLKASILSLSLVVSSSALMLAAPAPSAKAATSSTQAAKITSTAKSYIGDVKYRYGTRDPERLIFDCSSFTQFVFKKRGIDIPWGSRAQAKIGTYVSKSKLRSGDLVFFSVGTRGKISHVGIYIGNGKFISNTASKGVIITSLNSGYWGSRYITARRV